jgi:adenylate cyclase
MSSDQPDMPDFEAEGLLEGVEGRARTARERLLGRLYESGASLEELRSAVEDDRLVILPAERALGDDEIYTAAEVAEKADVPAEFFEAMLRAAGLAPGEADDRAYGETDLDAARIMARFYELGLDRDGMLEVGRVIGRGLAQAADAMGELFGQTFIKAGVTEEEVGLRNAEAAGVWLHDVMPLLEYLLKRHMRERLRHQAVSQAMLEAGEIAGARDVAIAFADMTSFTSLGEQLSAEEVGGLAGRLGEMASECVSPPVRLVKTIGDAVMLAAPEPESLVRGALELLTAAQKADDFPELHAGAAYGQALSRSGDWYGHPVNVASRVTDVAEPGTLLVTGELRDVVGDACEWTAVGARELKGIDGEIELFSLRTATSR